MRMIEILFQSGVEPDITLSVYPVYPEIPVYPVYPELSALNL
jgi:hypothetical protein